MTEKRLPETPANSPLVPSRLLALTQMREDSDYLPMLESDPLPATRLLYPADDPTGREGSRSDRGWASVKAS